MSEAVQAVGLISRSMIDLLSCTGLFFSPAWSFCDSNVHFQLLGKKMLYEHKRYSKLCHNCTSYGRKFIMSWHWKCWNQFRTGDGLNMEILVLLGIMELLKIYMSQLLDPTSLLPFLSWKRNPLLLFSYDRHHNLDLPKFL